MMQNPQIFLLMCGDTTCLVTVLRLVFRWIELSKLLNLYACKIVGFDLFLKLSGIRCIVHMARFAD
jgi:hypothetical protein